MVCWSANHAVRFLSSGEAPDASSDGGQSASTDGMNMGYERWIQQLEVWPLPPDADAQISKVGGEAARAVVGSVVAALNDLRGQSLW